MESKLRPGNSAFSLIEVIVAVTILSVGIIFILQAFSYSARITGLAVDINKAVFLAEDKIQEFEFKEAKGELGAEPSTGNDTNDKFEYAYTLIPDPGLDIYKFDLKINWQRQGRGNPEEIALDTYLLKK